MKKRSGFGGEPEEPTDGEEAAPPRQQRSQRDVPMLPAPGQQRGWPSRGRATPTFSRERQEKRLSSLQQPPPRSMENSVPDEASSMLLARLLISTKLQPRGKLRFPFGMLWMKEPC